MLTFKHSASTVILTCGDVEATLPRTERVRKLIGRLLRHMTPALLAAIEQRINAPRLRPIPGTDRFRYGKTVLRFTWDPTTRDFAPRHHSGALISRRQLRDALYQWNMLASELR